MSNRQTIKRHSTCDVWHSRRVSTLSDSCFCFGFFSSGPVPVVLQGSAGVPGELWPLCNITTLAWAASLVKPLRSVPSVPSQQPSTHLTPLKPTTTPLPPSYRGRRRRRKGHAFSPGDGFNQSQRSTLTQTNHMRFCFKYNTRNITVTLTNMTPVV